MIHLNTEHKFRIIFFITGLYLFLFTIIAVMRRNEEFIYYSIIVLTIFFILLKFRKKLYISVSSMIGLSFAQMLHVLGINIHIARQRLYDIWIIHGYFRYDNLVHLLSMMVVTIAMYDIMKNYLHEKIHNNKIILSLILILIVCGIGAFNEVMEFGAVLFFNAGAQVGDYTNNALDLVFNLLGALAGCIYLAIIIKKSNHRRDIRKV